MGGNVLLEFLEQERVNDFRFVVGNAFVKALVKREEMTSRARIGKLYGGHEFASGNWLWPPEGLAAGRKNFIAGFITDRGSTILCIGIGQVGLDTRGAMTVAAIKIHEDAIRPSSNRFHVNGVVQLDCVGITGRKCSDLAERREFGMTVLEAMDARGVSRVGLAVS